MAKIEVNVPDALVDEASRDKIRALERQVKSLEKKLASREAQIQKFEKRMAQIQGVTDAAAVLVNAVKEHHDLYEYDPWDDL